MCSFIYHLSAWMGNRIRKDLKVKGESDETPKNANRPYLMSLIALAIPL